MELGRCAGQENDLQNISAKVANKAGTHVNKLNNESRTIRSEFAYKLKCGISMAFMKPQAQQVLQLQRRFFEGTKKL